MGSISFSCPHLALMAKKCFEFYVLGGWMKMFKTILKPFDSQVMVPYEYISTDIYASKKVTINLMAIYWEQNWPLVPYSNACHMAQRKVTWKPFLQRSISLMAKKCLWSDLTFTSQVRRPILPYAQQASRIRKKEKSKKKVRRVPRIPVCSLLMIMVNCAFSWIHKEASKAKGEHDPNFPSSVLLAFLLQTSASCSLQWYARAIVAVAP